MDIYKTYVKDHIEEILSAKRKSPETIEELDRQLQYMTKAIDTLKFSTAKIQRKTKRNIIQQRDNNKKLIDDLERVRVRKENLDR